MTSRLIRPRRFLHYLPHSAYMEVYVSIGEKCRESVFRIESKTKRQQEGLSLSSLTDGRLVLQGQSDPFDTRTGGFRSAPNSFVVILDL